jgi:hypothetical protein
VTSARDRLCAAWEVLVTDAVALCKGHQAAHGASPASASETTSTSHGQQAHPRRPTRPDTIAVSTTTSCGPSSTGNPGEVRVWLRPQTSTVPLAPVVVEHVLPGKAAGQPFQAGTQNELPAGQSEVVVRIAPNFPVGMYLGKVQAPNTSSPFIIYLDGL